MRLASLAFGIVSAVSLLAIAAPARASTARESCEARLGGTYGATIQLPSNAPALLIQSSNYATMTAELVTGEARAPFQAPAADANGIMALTLPSNSIGEHKIVVDARCNGYSDGVRETPLLLVAPVPLPTKIGSIVEVPRPDGPDGTTTFRLEPGTNVREFLPVMQFWTTVNGEKAVAAAGPLPNAPIDFVVRSGAVCIENGALHREKRNVKLTVGAAIAGVEKKLEDVNVDITVDCGAIKWTRASDFDNEPTVPTNGAGAPGSQTSSSAGGCSAAPGTATPVSAGSFAALGLAALVVMRRRRR